MATLFLRRSHDQNPGKHRSAQCHRQIGEIECPESMGADSDVDEIDDAARGADAVEQISDRAPSIQSNRGDLNSIIARCLPVQVGENEQSAERQQDEPPARRWTERETHSSFGVVGKREAKDIVDDVVRQVGRRQLADGESLARDISEDGGEKDRPESIGSLWHESRYGVSSLRRRAEMRFAAEWER
jgi:hypothetical protein